MKYLFSLLFLMISFSVFAISYNTILPLPVDQNGALDVKQLDDNHIEITSKYGTSGVLLEKCYDNPQSKKCDNVFATSFILKKKEWQPGAPIQETCTANNSAECFIIGPGNEVSAN